MLSREVTQSNIVRVQVLGFGLVIVLLLTCGFVAIHNVRSIRQATGTLVREQATTQGLIDGVLETRTVLNDILYGLAAPSPTGVDRNEILANLDDVEQDIREIGQSASGTPERKLWANMDASTRQFADEVRRLLADPEAIRSPSQELLERHEELVSGATEMIRAAGGRISEAQKRIEFESSSLLTESIVLLGTGLLLSVIGAALTLRVTGDLIHRMEAQNNELNRVSWHMLENQETTARRFSHELHDELGQTLAAVKANLAALRGPAAVEDDRVQDCLQLTEEAIGNVRQMSQLLRPTILDDFGLGAGLRWLAEGFTQRTGIAVDCAADFNGRLADETETHLFRISQEALTNVARHSGATHVKMSLRMEDGMAALDIEDNGRGIEKLDGIGPGHLGLIGMRARARCAGGELKFKTGAGLGMGISVQVPARTESHEAAEDPHFISR